MGRRYQLLKETRTRFSLLSKAWITSSWLMRAGPVSRWVLEVGKNYGSILGTDFKRNENGDILIDKNTGLPLYDENLKTLGNSTWDWTCGFYSTFTYKNFHLTAAFDVKMGADLYSFSMRSAYLTGKAKGTLAGREEWYRSEEARKAAGMTEAEWRAAGKCEGLIVDGVIDNGDGTYSKNTYPVNPQNYWKSVAEKAPALFIYDNSYIKCREITSDTLSGKDVRQVCKVSLCFVCGS